MNNLFSRYMKEKRSSDHATLSASGSERWLGCPGSVRLSEGIPSVDSAASVRGTNTHTLLQFILENHKWFDLLESQEGVGFLNSIGYDSAMRADALFAAQYVSNEMNNNYKLQLYTEKKMKLEGVGFGTSDIILHQPYGVLHVMDYKNGTKAVEPEGNTQGLYYAYAAADLFKWEFSQVKITIIQPNAPHKRGHIRTWDVSEEELHQAGSMLKRGALATKKKDAPLVKRDSYCWFCPARESKCPLHQEIKQQKLLARFA